MIERIVIGTRGSKLALTQARYVAEFINKFDSTIKIEIKIIKTTGDKLMVALHEAPERGLFVKEIEEALLNKDIDLAVHSMKDMPAEAVSELEIFAVPVREDPSDVIVPRKELSIENLDDISPNSVFATSSLRRISLLNNFFTFKEIKDIRGNIDTRLKKLDEGFCDYLIMAKAALNRLGIKRNYITLDPFTFVPAVAQGALAIQGRRKDFNRFAKIIKFLDDFNTRISTDIERRVLKLIGGGCQIPFGCYVCPIKNKSFKISAFIEKDGNIRRVLFEEDFKKDKNEVANEIYKRLFS
ncbi:porphobilinogen deaminase [Thermodesulfobium narugense DSM 14796]|uniref:Hydroxymethylbilane synthase n=1 Tax=Thermodesulfobium narugense DSM 14796 TaxID=747365 RepID=M1E7S6_9BACT|nr:hydroxymethylbilane synthase [Thermodesulfobium narugense]AEE14600.1 porphobilinogen deaminase [Thermodesulfobium narugense DSM 14796]